MSLVPDTIVSLAEDDTIGGGKNIVAGASVNITKATGGSASIFSDAAGTSAISLPTVTGSNGELKFWIAPGLYIYTVNGENYNVNISEPNDFVIENVAALASTPVVAGQTYYLKEYHAGTGKGGGMLLGVSGSVTEDEVNTFSALTNHLIRINTDLDITHAGAVMDGTTDDSDAVLRFAAATNGKIIAPAGECLINNLILPDYDQLIIHCGGMPLPNSDLSELSGGTIFIGGISGRANIVSLWNFGVDDGSGRTSSAIDGCVINAIESELGIVAFVKNVSSLQPGYAGTRHAILLQGYERVVGDNIYCAEAQYGFVVKSRYANITNVNGDNCRTALLYPKSDISDFAADVADATAVKHNISNVTHRCISAITTAAAVYLHASTANYSGANVSNVDQTYGHSALKIVGGGTISDPSISNINAANITSDRSQYAYSMEGYNYDVSISNVGAVNPSTGRIAYIDGNSASWTMNNLRLTISDVAIGGTTAIEFLGTGVWDNISVRDPYTTRTIDTGAAGLLSRISGSSSGNCRMNRDENLTGINGAVAASEVPVIRILPNSVIKLSGRFDLTSSSNKFFCNLPINTGRQMVYACGGIDSTDAYVAVAVRLNDFQLSIEPTLPAGFKQIDLAGITITLD